MKKVLSPRYEGIGERIRQARGARQQMDFAGALGIGQSTLSGIEKGRQAPTAKQLFEVGAITGCDLNWLILGEGEKPKSHPAAPPPTTRAAEIWRDPAEAKLDPEMFRAWVPVIGILGPQGLLDHPQRGENEKMDPFLAFGPVPDGCVSVKLLTEVAGYPRDCFLVFAPPEGHPGIAGFGLFRVRGAPAYFAAAWARRGDAFAIFSKDTTIQSLPRSVIIEYRSLVAFVP